MNRRALILVGVVLLIACVYVASFLLKTERSTVREELQPWPTLDDYVEGRAEAPHYIEKGDYIGSHIGSQLKWAFAGKSGRVEMRYTNVGTLTDGTYLYELDCGNGCILGLNVDPTATGHVDRAQTPYQRTCVPKVVRAWAGAPGSRPTPIKVEDPIEFQDEVRAIEQRGMWLQQRGMDRADLPLMKRKLEWTGIVSFANIYTNVLVEPINPSLQPVLARSDHTATLLRDGRVLFVGGYNDGAALATAELYDPKTGTFTPTGRCLKPRGTHTAALMGDGRVLVVSEYGLKERSAEIYDPATRRWTAAPGPSHEFFVPMSVTLSDGRVLFAQFGFEESATPPEVFNPDSEKWNPTEPLPVRPHVSTLTRLADGRVLLIGATGPIWFFKRKVTTTALLFDPNNNTWRHTAAPQHVRGGLGTTLQDGRVLVSGGANCELYDPKTETWSRTGDLSDSRSYHTATLLNNGRVLVIAGSSSGPPDLPAAEVYDPETGQWSAAAPDAIMRLRHTATLLPDGSVLIAGGSSKSKDGPLPCERYRPR